MFTSVTPRYDLINRIITWGLDRRWREVAAKECLKSFPKRVLDLGCGTGDLAVAVARASKDLIDVTGLDFSQPMLEIARQKAAKSGFNNTTFVDGDAADIKFPSEYFDCVGISFAFRNLTYRNPITEKVLLGILRVLRPDGRLVIVESSQPESKLVRRLFHFYLRLFVANIGYRLSGNKSAYKYLSESAAGFYTPEKVKELLLQAGFREVACKPLSLGVAGIHVGVK